ncbi:hypothetical protein HDU77_007543 [Chytriomyces hyalinus]|nr:hypothetical protein HDU77_007543 [Chytriomyces hyalinus]
MAGNPTLSTLSTLSTLTPLGRGALAAVGLAEAAVVFTHAAWQRKRARVLAKAAALFAVLLCMRRSTWVRIAFARGLYYAALVVGGPSFKAIALQKQQQPITTTKATPPKPTPTPQQLPPPPALANKVKPTPISTPTPSLIEAPRFSPSSQPGSPISDIIDFDAGDDYFVDALDVGPSSKSTPSLTRVQPIPIASVEPSLADLLKSAFTLETMPANQNKQLAALHLSAPESQATHAFSESLDRALIQFMQLEHMFSKKEATLTKWTLETTRENITIHTHPVAQDSAFSVVRGCGELPAGFTVAECLSVIRSTACRKTWDARYDSGTVLQVLGVDDGVAHTIQKGSFPVAARDMIVAVTTRRVSRREAVFVATSVTDDGDAFPKSGASGRVRAELTFAGWMLRASSGANVEAVYMVQVDPKGTIPSSIVKLVQTQTPLAIARVSEYLNKHGPVPFIIQVPSDDAYSVFVNPASTMNALFRGETWDPAASVYTCSMDVNSAETAFSVAIPKVSFGGDASCTVSVHFKWLANEEEQAPPVQSPRVKGSILVGFGVAMEVDAERRRTWLKAVVGDATGAVLRVHATGGGGAAAAGGGEDAGMWRMEVKIAKRSVGTGVVMNGEKVAAFV